MRQRVYYVYVQHVEYTQPSVSKSLCAADSTSAFACFSSIFDVFRSQQQVLNICVFAEVTEANAFDV